YQLYAWNLLRCIPQAQSGLRWSTQKAKVISSRRKGHSAQPELQLRPRVASLEKGRNFRDVLRALQALYTNVLSMITWIQKHCLFCFAQRLVTSRIQPLAVRPASTLMAGSSSTNPSPLTCPFPLTLRYAYAFVVCP